MYILVVEDERRLAQVIRRVLEEEGHTVDVAYDGEEGLAMAMEGSHDVIVLDILLPELDGIDVCQSLRRNRVDTPVLLLTATHDLDDRVRGLEGGADDYVTKPFDLPELLARIVALIRRAHLRHEDTTLTVGCVTLDPLKHQVMNGDRTIDLTPREFALLNFLMRNAGRTLSRSRIAEAVWNYQFDPETNVVDVYVNYLRKKVGFETGGAAIRTVRGVGYRLEAE